MNKPSAIIIGAGYGGMALANILGKAGYTVHVYEKNPSAGGRISVIKQDGFVFDLGPSWYLMPEVFEQYYSLFNQSATERLDLMRFTPGYKVFFEKYPPLEPQGDVSADKNIFESIESGAGEKLSRYIKKSSLAYEMSVRYFLYNNFSKLTNLIRWPIIKHAPALLGLTTRNLDSYVKTKFSDLRLRQLLEYHMVFLGSSPFQAPAIYTLMSHLDFKSGVFYPKRGMFSLVTDMMRLGEAYDITYHFNQPVRSILTKQDTAKGIKLESGKDVFADIVISNADLHYTETVLLPTRLQSFPDRYWQKRQPGPGALLISLGVRGSLPALRHHNLYFVDSWRENFEAIYQKKHVPADASIYICNPTKTDRSLAPTGHENLFVLMPIPAGVELSTEQQDHITEQTIDLVARLAEAPDLHSRITSRLVFGPSDFASTFNAWKNNAFGGESHLLKQSLLFRTPNMSRKVKNLYYVGAGTVPGIGLPMCLIGAQLTYKQIVGSKKQGPLSEDLA